MIKNNVRCKSMKGVKFCHVRLLNVLCCQLLHHVELVEPALGDRKWSVKVRDLQRDAVVTEGFDAIMVCNGHYFEPWIPKISGRDIFAGKQMHSHDYRVPEIFDGKTVVVLGAGPSGTPHYARNSLPISLMQIFSAIFLFVILLAFRVIINRIATQNNHEETRFFISF